MGRIYHIIWFQLISAGHNLQLGINQKQGQSQLNIAVELCEMLRSTIIKKKNKERAVAKCTKQNKTRKLSALLFHQTQK